jgi:hypothetical protein
MALLLFLADGLEQCFHFAVKNKLFFIHPIQPSYNKNFNLPITAAERLALPAGGRDEMRLI